jgi:hypothetical protein
MDAAAVVRFYRQRGECSENRIKELKGGFGLNRLPSGDFFANAFYFQILLLAYNLFLLFKETLQPDWRHHTIQTLRYKLYTIAGKVVHHARRTILRIPDPFVELFHTIRQRTLKVYQE